MRPGLLLACLCFSYCYTVVDLKPPHYGSPLRPVSVPGPTGVSAFLKQQGLSGRHLQTVRGLTGLLDRYCVKNPAFSFSFERWRDALREDPDLPACYGVYFDLYGKQVPRLHLPVTAAKPL